MTEKLEPLSTEEWERMVRLGCKRKQEPLTDAETVMLSALLEREKANLPDLEGGFLLGLTLIGMLARDKR